MLVGLSLYQLFGQMMKLTDHAYAEPHKQNWPLHCVGVTPVLLLFYSLPLNYLFHYCHQNPVAWKLDRLTSVCLPQTVHLVLRFDLGGFCLFSYAPKQPVLQNSWKDSLESTWATMVPFMFVMSLENTNTSQRMDEEIYQKMWIS